MNCHYLAGRVYSPLRWIAYIALALQIGLVRAADLNIAAAISLKSALEQARPELEKATGDTINFNFGASGTLAAQIQQGAPTDLFISADQATIDRLVKAKLIDENTVTILAGNQLVLAIPKSPRLGVAIKGFADLTQSSVQRIAIGEPKTVPAGAYAVQTLRFLKLYDTLAQQDKFIKTENVAQVLAYVARGEVDAGLAYRTDALASPNVQMIAQAPPESHDPIVYLMGILKDSPHASAAQTAEQSLLAGKVQQLLAGLGFTPATQPKTTTETQRH